MAKKNIPNSDHLLRFCDLKTITKRDENGDAIAISPAAFIPRTRDKGMLSMNWLEYFSGTEESQLKSNLDALRNRLEVDKKSALAKCKISDLKSICSNLGTVAEATHAPSRKSAALGEGNPAHCLFGVLNPSNFAMFLTLSETGYTELISVRTIDKDERTEIVSTEPINN